ncbi:MAG: hypothetical protein SF028_06675 [Candidatus Sumerlaeia bacterium]|nr:hypothetical protein [Candidatus Sumerlaeia bacterium]
MVLAFLVLSLGASVEAPINMKVVESTPSEALELYSAIAPLESGTVFRYSLRSEQAGGGKAPSESKSFDFKAIATDRSVVFQHMETTDPTLAASPQFLMFWDGVLTVEWMGGAYTAFPSASSVATFVPPFSVVGDMIVGPDSVSSRALMVEEVSRSSRPYLISAPEPGVLWVSGKEPVATQEGFTTYSGFFDFIDASNGSVTRSAAGTAVVWGSGSEVTFLPSISMQTSGGRPNEPGHQVTETSYGIRTDLRSATSAAELRALLGEYEAVAKSRSTYTLEEVRPVDPARDIVSPAGLAERSLFYRSGDSGAAPIPIFEDPNSKTGRRLVFNEATLDFAPGR